MSKTPHLERACELLWQSGNPRLADALEAEVDGLARAAAAALDAARATGSLPMSVREDLAEALGLSRKSARGRYAIVRAAGEGDT